MNQTGRTERVAAEIKRLLALMFLNDVRDPRLGGISIQEVQLSRDLSYARIYYTRWQGDDSRREVEKILTGKIASFLRSRLAGELRLRVIPRLHFEYDHSIEDARHMYQLLDETSRRRGPEPDQET